MSDEELTKYEKVSPRYEYMKDYYSKNKEKILARRKERYQNDPVYRAKVNENRRKNAAKKRAVKRNSVSYEEYTIDRGKDMRIVSPCGTKSHVCKMYTLGMIADMSGIPKTQIYSWVNKKRIPMSHYTTPKGWRLYTAYEAKIISNFIKRKKQACAMRGYQFRWEKVFTEELVEAVSHLHGGIPASKFK